MNHNGTYRSNPIYSPYRNPSITPFPSYPFVNIKLNTNEKISPPRRPTMMLPAPISSAVFIPGMFGVLIITPFNSHAKISYTIHTTRLVMIYRFVFIVPPLIREIFYGLKII
jgi:hypothetical protein